MMGKLRHAALGGILLLAVTLPHSEQITAESNTFTFPAMIPVTVVRSVVANPYFRHTALTPFSRTVSFSWSLPGVAEKQTGVITVYSLLGRVVARIPVARSTGTAQWNFQTSQCRSGIYLARISLSGQTRNLKLMLWN